MEAVKIIGLTKKYKNITAVDGLNLTVQAGELFSLLGVNGAGKSTVIKILSCLTVPDSGNAFLNGKSILRDTADVKSMIAVSPQETAIAPNLSVEENLSLLCGIHGFSGTEITNKTTQLSQMLGLDTVINRKAGKLSGGWQRRLSIAMALVSEPQILFLDEPTLGLDIIARSELWEIIRSLRGKTTIILTTHYMEEAESLSDTIGIMKDGRLLCCGSPDEIKAQTGTEKIEDAFLRIVKETAV